MPRRTFGDTARDQPPKNNKINGNNGAISTSKVTKRQDYFRALKG